MAVIVHIYRSNGSIGYRLSDEKRCSFGASHPDDAAQVLIAVLRDWQAVELKLYGGGESQELGGGTALAGDDLARFHRAFVAEGFVVS